MTAAGSRPRVADLVPRLQLRGAEIFAQHLEVALRDRFEPRLFPLYAGGERFAGTGDEAPVDVDPGVPDGRARLWRSRRSLRARAAAFDPEVIVAHGGDPVRHAVLAGLHRRAPLAYVRVAAVTPDLRTPARSRSLRHAYGKVDAFVAVSGSLRDELVEVFGIARDRIRVIPNGRLAPPRLEPARRERLRAELGVAEPGRTLIVWAGRFVPEKDPAAAVRLARRLPAAAHLAIVGAGPLEPEVRAAAAGVPNLTLTGERPDAPALIAAADLLVSTSRTEGAPGVFVEALMAGVPVVAHDMGGVRDAIPPETGALVPAGDEEALAGAVTGLVQDPDRRARAAAAAREAGARAGIGPVADAYAELYRELLSAPARRGAASGPPAP